MPIASTLPTGAQRHGLLFLGAAVRRLRNVCRHPWDSAFALDRKDSQVQTAKPQVTNEQQQIFAPFVLGLTYTEHR
jgi:hypothetical protein